MRLRAHRRMNWQIFIMAMAGVAFLFVFSYIPMIGILIGFKDLDYTLNVMKDLQTKPFVGLENFIKFVPRCAVQKRDDEHNLSKCPRTCHNVSHSHTVCTFIE